MSTDVAGELEDLRARMRTLEGAYRSNDRQVALQRLGAGPNPQSLRLGERPDSIMGATSGFTALGGVQPWHGQSNLLLDPTFESIDPSGFVFGAFAGTSGEWGAFFVNNSGTAPGAGIAWPLIARSDPDNNPFSSAILIFFLTIVAGSAHDLDIYLYPVTDFSPGSIPRLPYLVSAVRWAVDWSIVGSASPADYTTSMTMQLVELTGPTIVSESAERTLPSEEGQLQMWCSTDLAEEGDWQWRLKIHVESDVLGSDVQVTVGVAEPQLHYAYTPDPIPFQPAIAAWSQDTDHEHDADYSDIAHTHGASGAFAGAITLTGIISPSALGASQNDWNPTGLSTANVIRMTGDAGGTSLTGLAAQESGRMILLFCIGGGVVTLEDENAGSSAANRFVENQGISGGAVRVEIGSGVCSGTTAPRLVGAPLRSTHRGFPPRNEDLNMVTLADVHTNQLDDPTTGLDGLNCTCAAGAAAIKWRWRNTRPTPDPELIWPPRGGDVRHFCRNEDGSLDTEGGTNLVQVQLAMQRGWGAALAVLTNAPFDMAWDYAREPDVLVIWQIQYSVLHGTRWACSETFMGAHACAGNAADDDSIHWSDPLADGRRPGIPRGVQTLPRHILREACGKLVVDPRTGRRRGLGRANFAITRLIERPATGAAAARPSRHGRCHVQRRTQRHLPGRDPQGRHGPVPGRCPDREAQRGQQGHTARVPGCHRDRLLRGQRGQHQLRQACGPGDRGQRAAVRVMTKLSPSDAALYALVVIALVSFGATLTGDVDTF